MTLPLGVNENLLLIGGVILVLWVLAMIMIVVGIKLYRSHSRDPKVAPANDGETVADGGVVAGNYDALRTQSVENPDVVEFPPPQLKGGRFGTFGEMLGMWRRVRKRRKMAKKGYVQWYLVDETFPTPKFVKPEMKGGGIPELKYKGITYLFPKNGKLPAEEQGLWTYLHKKGEADPVKIDEPLEYAIDGDELSEYLAKRVTSSPPGLLDKLDLNLSPRQIMAAGIVGIILLSIFMRFFGGG